MITLEAMNPRSGDPIAREQIEAESKEKVLSSLGTAASNLRQKLGESLSSIQKYDVNIEQATTSSLEALKAYAMANEERAKGNSRESLTFYKRAIELDPNFAMAYARIGVHYVNQEQSKPRKNTCRRLTIFAIESANANDSTSRRSITRTSPANRQDDRNLQTWARLYPNDFHPA